VLTPHVYRQANLTNTSDYVLLPGEATMYLGTDFVGRAQLPLVAIGKQFTVGFGVDPQLQVQRQMQNKTRSTTGGNQVLTFDYRILVNSYKKEAVKLQLWDRLPKAEAQAVAVTLVSQKPDVSADPLYVREERPKNLLRWDLTVQPAQNGEKALAGRLRVQAGTRQADADRHGRGEVESHPFSDASQKRPPAGRFCEASLNDIC